MSNSNPTPPTASAYTTQDVLGGPIVKQETYKVVVPENLKLQDLRKSGMMCDQDWYDKYNFTAEAGTYEVMMPVLESNNKTWSEQVKMLPKGWDPCPVLVGAFLWMAHKNKSGYNLFGSDCLRLAEESQSGYRVVLYAHFGRLDVSSGWYWDGYRDDFVWASAARLLSDS